jgi:hypothetical protein
MTFKHTLCLINKAKNNRDFTKLTKPKMYKHTNGGPRIWWFTAPACHTLVGAYEHRRYAVAQAYHHSLSVFDVRIILLVPYDGHHRETDKARQR